MAARTSHSETRQPADAAASAAAGGGGRSLDLRRLLRPWWLVLVPLALSFAAWAIPWGSGVRTGYRGKEPFAIGSLLVLVAWYGLIVGAAVIGFGLGRRLRPAAVLDRFPAERYYRAITVVGAVGVVYAYARVFVTNPDLLSLLLRGASVNEIRLALPYSTGIHTLRYAAILGGAIALWRIGSRRRVTALDAVNLVALAGAAAISSRLSIILAVLMAAALAVHSSPSLRLRSRKTVAILAVPVAVFLVLTPLTYVRNATFYRLFFHTGNPLVMNAYEVIAYLGAPFQASVAAARDAASRTGVGSAPPRRTLPRGQLLPNGDFRRGTADWRVYSDGARVRVERVGPRGGAALVATATRPGDNFANLQQRRLFPISSQRSFTLTARFRKLRGTAVAHSVLRIVALTANGGVAGYVYPNRSLAGADPATADFDPPRRWARYGGRFENALPAETASAYMEVYAFADAEGPISVGVADVRFTVAPAAPPGLGAQAEMAGRGYLLPTYFGPLAASPDLVKTRYRDYVDIEQGLTTNSAFAEMYSAVGFLAFPVIALVALVGSAVVGHATRYASYFLLAGYAVAYCFAELWRTYLFNAGIIHFLVLILLAIPLVDRYVVPRIDRSLRERLRRELARSGGAQTAGVGVGRARTSGSE